MLPTMRHGKMADFCVGCSCVIFREAGDDLAGLITKEECEKGYRMPALCEGCGMICVDHLGRKWTQPTQEEWVMDERIYERTL